MPSLSCFYPLSNPFLVSVEMTWKERKSVVKTKEVPRREMVKKWRRNRNRSDRKKRPPTLPAREDTTTGSSEPITNVIPQLRNRKMKRQRMTSCSLSGGCRKYTKRLRRDDSSPGVAYSLPNFMDETSNFKFITSLRRHELTGTYDAVFLVSNPSLVPRNLGQSCPITSIHHTIDGSAEMKMIGNGKIIGNLDIQHCCRWKNHTDGYRACFGERDVLGDRPVQRSIKSPKPEARADGWISPAGMLDLVIVPDIDPRERWWNLNYDDPIWTYNKPSDCRLKVLANRVPIGLLKKQDHFTTDEMADCSTLARAISLEEADTLKKNFFKVDGSTSWLCNHFNIPVDVTMLIKTFSTPFPVYYFEPGDVFLLYHDNENDSNCSEKCVVLRKKLDEAKADVEHESIALLNSSVHETPAEFVDLLFG